MTSYAPSSFDVIFGSRDEHTLFYSGVSTTSSLPTQKSIMSYSDDTFNFSGNFVANGGPDDFRVMRDDYDGKVLFKHVYTT